MAQVSSKGHEVFRQAGLRRDALIQRNQHRDFDPFSSSDVAGYTFRFRSKANEPKAKSIAVAGSGIRTIEAPVSIEKMLFIASPLARVPLRIPDVAVIGP